MSSVSPAQPATLARLDALLTKVPARVNSGSYNLSVDFKAAVVKAVKVRNKRGLAEWEAQSACLDLEKFAKDPIA